MVQSHVAQLISALLSTPGPMRNCAMRILKFSGYANLAGAFFGKVISTPMGPATFHRKSKIVRLSRSRASFETRISPLNRESKTGTNEKIGRAAARRAPCLHFALKSPRRAMGKRPPPKATPPPHPPEGGRRLRRRPFSHLLRSDFALRASNRRRAAGVSIFDKHVQQGISHSQD